MQFATLLSNTPSYIQCGNWGGGGGGINCWYNCRGASDYTNTIVTHRSNGYAESSGITNNPSGNNLGSSSTAYDNDVLLWVR